MPRTATKTLATLLEAWAVDVTDPPMSSYPDEPEDLDEAYPIVVADIQRDRQVEGQNEPGLKVQQFQQVYLRVVVVRLTLLVSPNPPWTAAQALYDYGDQLARALKDRTLGGRVKVASPLYDADYSRGEVEHPSGSVARAATFDITVGEQTEV